MQEDNKNISHLIEEYCHGDIAKAEEINKFLSDAEPILKTVYSEKARQEIKQSADVFSNLHWFDWNMRLGEFEEKVVKNPGEYFFDKKEKLPNTTEELASRAVRIDIDDGLEIFNPKTKTLVETNHIYVIEPLAMHILDFSDITHYYGVNMFNVNKIADKSIPMDLNRQIMKCYISNKLIRSEFGTALTEVDFMRLTPYDLNFFLEICVKGALSGVYSLLKKAKTEVMKASNI